MPKLADISDGSGVLVRVLKVGVDATDREPQARCARHPRLLRPVLESEWRNAASRALQGSFERCDDLLAREVASAPEPLACAAGCDTEDENDTSLQCLLDCTDESGARRTQGLALVLEAELESGPAQVRAPEAPGTGSLSGAR